MSTADRGLASLPPDKRKAISQKGGLRAHQLGVAHEWDKAEAREAGRKGGLKAAANRRARIEAERLAMEVNRLDRLAQMRAEA